MNFYEVVHTFWTTSIHKKIPQENGGKNLVRCKIIRELCLFNYCFFLCKQVMYKDVSFIYQAMKLLPNLLAP